MTLSHPRRYPNPARAGRKVVMVLDVKRCSGDCGPCMDEHCDNRASDVVTLLVGGAECITWLCDEHSLPWRAGESS